MVDIEAYKSPLGSSPEEVQEHEDQTEFALESKGEIKRFLKGDEPITAGPIYTTRSTLDEEVTIITASKIVDHKGKPITTYLFVAMDRNGKLLGHRTTYLEPHEDNFTGTGYVTTVQRNAGIVMCIELANEDLLQRYATDNQREIYYYAINGNANHLKKLNKRYEELLANGDQSSRDIEERILLETEIKRTEEEQMRWQAVWGENGKLGYDHAGGKTFNPSSEPQEVSLSEIDTLHLVRSNNQEATTAKVDVVSRITEDSSDRTNRQVKRLNDVFS
jgi:hypothetical protein